MYRPDANIDRSLANGSWTPPERRDYNAPVTGQHANWHHATPDPRVIPPAFPQAQTGVRR